MTTFVDYAWWQPTPALLRAMGFSGVMRYLSHDVSKDLSIPERDNLRAAGFDIGLVCESQANRAAQGFAAGQADAVLYNQRADGLGYPADCTLFYAVDFDASPSQVQSYFDGVASVGGRLEAPYGGIRVVQGLRYRAPWGWQTVAWSNHLVGARAGLLQDGFHDTYDSNRVLVSDFGQWQAHATPTPPAKSAPLLITQKETPMQATKRPSKFDGHDVYDIYVTGVGTEAQQTTADGRKVRCVRSVLRIDPVEGVDAEIQTVAKGADLGVSGVPATGGEFACPTSGRVSIVNHSDAATALIVDYSEVWA